VCLFLFIDRITSIVVLDDGADRVGNTASTVDTVISRNIGVDSIVHFNFDSRTSPGVVDSDLTAVADYWSHWHFSLFSEEHIERAEQCGQSVPFTESKMRWQLQHRCLTQGPCDTAARSLSGTASVISTTPRRLDVAVRRAVADPVDFVLDLVVRLVDWCYESVIMLVFDSFETKLLKVAFVD